MPAPAIAQSSAQPGCVTLVRKGALILLNRPVFIMQRESGGQQTKFTAQQEIRTDKVLTIRRGFLQ